MKSAFSFHAATDGLKLAEKYSDIVFYARKLAGTVTSGHHHRQKSGQGEEFWQYREIRSGEPLSRIDWRQSARSRHIYTRETEHHIAQTFCIYSDFSGSMTWRSSKNLPTKLEYSLTIHLAIAYLVLKKDELLAFIDALTHSKHIYQGAMQFERYALQLYMLAQQTDHPSLISSFAPSHALPPRSTLILLSDFLTPIEKIAHVLKTTLSQGITPILVQINDPDEHSFPYSGHIRFTGLEGEEAHILPHAQSTQQAYQEKFKGHLKNIQQLCQHHGVFYSYFITSTPYDRVMDWLYTPLTAPS